MVAVGIVLAAGIGVWLTRRSRAAPADSRPAWMGLDPVVVESDLRRELDQARWARSLPALRSDAGLDEMARHQAQVLVTRRDGSPGGEADGGVRGRRLRLYPELLGTVDESSAVVQTTEASEALERLTETFAESWTAPVWTAGAVGVAAGSRRVAACVVVARRVAVLEAAPWLEDPSRPGEAVISNGDLILDGVLTEAASPSPQFAIRLPGGDTLELPSSRDSSGRFHASLRLEESGEFQLLADGTSVFVFRFGNLEQY